MTVLYGENGEVLEYAHLTATPGYFDDPDEPELGVE